jgi:hypothetical protein
LLSRRAELFLGFLCALVIGSQDAEAAFLTVCPTENETIRAEAHWQDTILNADGSARFAALLDNPPPLLPAACAIAELPFSAQQIAGVALYPEKNDQPEQLGLQGRWSEGKFQIAEIARPLPTPATTSSPAETAATANSDLPTAKAQHGKGRSAWIWGEEKWRNAAQGLLEKLAANGVTEIFVTVPIDRATGLMGDPEGLSRFISQARSQNIAVWAADGDPRAVLPEERAHWLARAKTYAAYNASAPKEMQLAGVALDVEPYLLPGYAASPVKWHQAYAEFVAEFAKEAGMPIDLAVPFWFNQAELTNGRLLDALAPHISVLTVMGYRTDVEIIRSITRPFLEWGSRQEKLIRIALEAGPLPDEEHRLYKKSEKGELWLIDLAGLSFAILLKEAKSNPVGATLAFSHAVPSPARRLTFHGEESKLLELLPLLENELAVWPSFKGIALHEFAPLFIR